MSRQSRFLLYKIQLFDLLTVCTKNVYIKYHDVITICSPVKKKQSQALRNRLSLRVKQYKYHVKRGPPYGELHFCEMKMVFPISRSFQATFWQMFSKLLNS